MSLRLAAYAVCLKDGRVLLAHHVPPQGEANWTLPGGRVEHGEDPFDTVITGRHRPRPRTDRSGNRPRRPVPVGGLIQH